ncbi:putative oligonucleotidase [Helianthus annuus]|nr:putative oligonucleotidase [Helianthus annuus]
MNVLYTRWMLENSLRSIYNVCASLNVEVDRILEIACVITDGKLRKLVEGPDLVIHQTKDFLDEVGRRAKIIMYGSNNFVKGHVSACTPSLAGNCWIWSWYSLTESVGCVRCEVAHGLNSGSSFRKYMPDLASLFSHVLVDVSSVKVLCCHWFQEGII